MTAREVYVALRAMEAFIKSHVKLGDYPESERAEHETVRRKLCSEWARLENEALKRRIA